MESETKIEPKLYLHTPNYAPEKVNAKLLLCYLCGYLKDYQLHRYKDNTVHLVHDKYERYIIRTSTISQEYEFTERNACITFCQEVNDNFPNLVELITTNWKGTFLQCRWYKPFTHSKFRPLKILKRKVMPEHPFKKYIL